MASAKFTDLLDLYGLDLISWLICFSPPIFLECLFCYVFWIILGYLGTISDSVTPSSAWGTK